MMIDHRKAKIFERQRTQGGDGFVDGLVTGLNLLK